MTRHWRPRRRDWTVIGNYAPTPQVHQGGRFVVLVLGAVFAGLTAGVAWQWWPQQPTDSGPSAPIEWNAVQAAPKRTLTADEIAWEKRGQDAAVATKPTASVPVAVTMVTEGSFGICGQQGGRNCVIDGDTFVVRGEHVRIRGADAPETHPPRCVQEAELGLAATAKLQELLNSGTVSMGPITRDKYGRDVRQVVVNGVDVAHALIANGLASSYSGGRRQGWC